MNGRFAVAVGERAGDRRDEHRRHRPRQQTQSGLQRRVSEERLKELRHQEQRAEQPGVEQEADGV